MHKKENKIIHCINKVMDLLMIYQKVLIWGTSPQTFRVKKKKKHFETKQDTKIKRSSQALRNFYPPACTSFPLPCSNSYL